MWRDAMTMIATSTCSSRQYVIWWCFFLSARAERQPYCIVVKLFRPKTFQNVIISNYRIKHEFQSSYNAPVCLSGIQSSYGLMLSRSVAVLQPSCCDYIVRCNPLLSTPPIHCEVNWHARTARACVVGGSWITQNTQPCFVVATWRIVSIESHDCIKWRFKRCVVWYSVMCKQQLLRFLLLLWSRPGMMYPPFCLKIDLMLQTNFAPGQKVVVCVQNKQCL